MLGNMANGLHRIVVDAANVIGSRPDGWWRDRPGAARRLYERLCPLADSGSAVVVVLEGTSRAGVAEQAGPIRVVHAPRDGDRAIVELIRAEADPAEWTVVTADRALASQVRDLGAQVIGPSELFRALDL
jgi:hypothetical protein